MTQGKLNTINIDIDNPVAFKTLSFEMRELNLITGLNGSGKSFLLVTSWVLEYIISNIIAMKIIKQPLDIIKICQYVIQNSLNCNKTTGSIEGIFDNCFIKIILDKGIVISCDFDLDKIDEIKVAHYISANMRTFTIMDIYGKSRNNLIKSIGHLKAIDEMVKHYRLYEVFFMENLLGKLPMVITVPSKEHLKSFDFPDELDMLGFDEDGFYVTLLKDDEKKYISKQYGAGHQSLINMILAMQN